MVVVQSVVGKQLAPTASPRSGERGIRTPGPVSWTQHFQCCTIGHSAISPKGGKSSGNLGLCQLRQVTGIPVRHSSAI